MSLRFTLVADGSSDQALLPILSWLLRASQVSVPVEAFWADPATLRNRTRHLRARLLASVELYPCDLLFVHRDAEAQAFTQRRDEILATVEALRELDGIPTVSVVPVRMTEAWLLFDEMAIRAAAGNPNGRGQLSIPPVTDAEQLPNPKSELLRLVRAASGLSSRRRKGISIRGISRLVAAEIADFSPLRVLPAFRALEQEVKATVEKYGWNQTQTV